MGGGGGGVYPTLQPESLLYNQNPHFTTHKLFRNPHFATGCEGFLTSLLTDNVKAWNLQHHPLQQPCRLESNAGCNVGVLKPKCMCVYIYINKSVLYVHDVVDVVFALLCHTSTNVIEFLFLCHPKPRAPSSKAACHPSKLRGPPAPKPRATRPNSAGPQLSHMKSIISTSLHGRTLFSPEWTLFQIQIHRCNSIIRYYQSILCCCSRKFSSGFPYDRDLVLTRV